MTDTQFDALVTLIESYVRFAHLDFPDRQQPIRTREEALTEARALLVDDPEEWSTTGGEDIG